MTEDHRTAQTEGWVRRYMEIVDGKDLDAVSELVADDAAYEDCAYGAVRGKEALREWGAGLFAGMPDLKREIVNLAVTGRVAIGEFTYTGTHAGEYFGFAPTGKVVSWQAAVVYEFNEDGLLQRQMYYNDARGLEAQLAGDEADG